jgi:hypothetical protein
MWRERKGGEERGGRGRAEVIVLYLVREVPEGRVSNCPPSVLLLETGHSLWSASAETRRVRAKLRCPLKKIKEGPSGVQGPRV